eukprot:6522968-Pyramimonas_sp.AAC.1
MSPAALTKTGLLQKIGGMIATADVEATCLLSTGTHIDNIMCSIAARPFIPQVLPIESVPWRPHIGLE